MSRRFSLPVLPLRDTVVYPGVAVPISAGRPGTVEAVQEALDGDRRLFAVAQNQNQDDPDPQILYAVGTMVRIIQTHRVRGGIQLLVQGEARARAVAYADDGEAMLRATVVPLERENLADPDDPAIKALDAELRERAAELATRRGATAENLNQLIQGVDDPGAFADLVAFQLDLPTFEKQSLLETLDDQERMNAALVAVERELVRLDAQEDIQAKVQEELGERQREMLLREQMKQIRKELGEEGDRDDVEELRDRISKLELSETARNEVERELRRLDRTAPQAAEYQVIRTYLEWITELPWSARTDDKINLHRAEEILDEDHYGLEDVKDRVLEFLAVRKLQQERFEEDEGDEEEAEASTDDADAAGDEDEAAAADPEDEAAAAESEATEDDSPEDFVNGTGGKGPILLFAGPPGVGKTSIAKSIARSVGRKYVRISLGGARDEADIRGHRRTYVGAMPGRIVQGMKEAGSKNPVFLLDEVDKLGVSFQGDPSAALLEVLDPAQNSTFIDHYLGVPFDLSEVLFIATANYEDRIPAPLLDRMETVGFRGYTEKEKLEIALRYLLPRQMRESGLREEELEVGDDAILTVIQKYTREAGVRQLERELGKLARKVARKIASAETEGMEITPAVAMEMLGRPRVHPERRATEDTAGVATGMFYTPMGGDIMFVEASVMPGEGGLVLTGQLGDVMKESARAALSYAKSHYAALGIDEDALDKREIHIHVPAGAVPKDGPSAGITMATALISAVSGRKVRADLAMTGELTLTGRVLPIGGVKEKVLGAVRAGINEVILPSENEAHLEDLPDAVRNSLTVHLVEDLDRVVELAIRGVRTKPVKAAISTVRTEEAGAPIRA
ncbi:MAG: endopeptidase La [Gemmatimonadetes bacterium]|nr:endopeptidase La [Gemmatimonadota bacterium]MYA64169.1 endopeptidase La [Gemmatimonadota bacterium]MYB98545.1 endopeptidase La [Gemmatimonadota bacterium]MYH54224.1 endopeptidase La [Gemmatimonadota bacterium]MYI44844.1 endopeptidase La [Gemmatimonadota bacterium]